MQDLIKEIISLKLGKVLINEELKNYTTYRVGGKARAIVYPSSIDNLTKLINKKTAFSGAVFFIY